MATQKEFGSENFKKIQVLEPPQIDLRTEPKLVGTNGMLLETTYLFLYIEKIFHEN